MRVENNWNIPNVLTVFRIMLTPAFVMSFIDNRVGYALLIFTLAGITDALDGFLARVLRQRTRLGAMLDPLADKVLIVTCFLCLGLREWLPPWLAVLVISRDFVIVGGLMALNFWGVDVHSKIQPTFASKCNTTAQLCLIFLVLVDHAQWFSWPLLETAIMGVTVVFTIYTGLSYVLRGLALFPAGQD